MNVRRLVPALCVGLVLSAAALAAPSSPAQAQQVVDEVCVTGIYVDGTCETRTGQAPDCAPGTCAVELTRPTQCVNPSDCPIIIDAQQGPPTCPDGTLGRAGFCYIEVAPGPDGCPKGSGVFPDDSCAQQVANKRGAYFCEDGALSGRQCTVADDPVYGFCPAPSEPADGACIDFAIEGLAANCGLLNEDFIALRCIEPAGPLPADASSCEVPAQLVETSCVVPTVGVAVNYCTYLGEDPSWTDTTGGRCVTYTLFASASCPAGFGPDSSLGRSCTRFESAQRCTEGLYSEEGVIFAAEPGTCFAFATLADSATACPAGFTVDYSFSGTWCVKAEPPTQAGEPVCPAQAVDNGDSCTISVAFSGVSEPSCLFDERTSNPCRVFGNPRLTAPNECPHGAGDLLEGTTCYRTVDPDATGACPANATMINDACLAPVTRRPGPAFCAQPGFFALGADCQSFVPASEPVAQCVIDRDASQGCFQRVGKVAGALFCSDPAATFDGQTCTVTTALIQSVTPADYVCASGSLSLLYGSGRPVCLFADPIERFCPADGALNGRSCVFTAAFAEFTCPAMYTRFASTSLCERFAPQQVEYSCGDGVLTTNPDGTPQCWEQQGPQPGECPSIERDGECYRFVDHQRVCAPGGCLVSSAAVPAPPTAERGDVNCDGQLAVFDALQLARSISDDSIARESACSAVTSTSAIRITAGDLSGDGTVNATDTRQLLQCLVDNNLADCAT